MFGAEYARGASTTDVSKLTLTTADTSKLPSEFVSYVLDPSGAAGPQTVNVTVKVAGDPAKFVFTKGTTTDAWDPMVDGINEEDTYIFDTSDVSMKGYTLGFSDVKDNGTGGTPLAAADGVTVADAAPGTTGAKTTLVLPAGYGGDQGQNVKELHIYGAEVQPIAIEKVLFDEANATFEIVPVSPGAFTGTPYYEWSKMELTTGGSSGETVGIDTLLATGPAGGTQIVNGKLVVNIDATKVASLATSLGDADADTVAVLDGFSVANSGVQVTPSTQAIAVDDISSATGGGSGTQTGLVYADKAGMGTTDAAGAAVTDMVRSIQSSVSTEGMMEETTYFVNGQIVGYSRDRWVGPQAQALQILTMAELLGTGTGTGTGAGAHLAGLSFMMRTITVLVRAALMVWVVTT